LAGQPSIELAIIAIAGNLDHIYNKKKNAKIKDK
jgi:hypothetical protein